MNTTVKMNGSNAKREIKVVRRKVIVIKDASGEEHKVKLFIKAKPDTSTISETEKSIEELNKLFPKSKEKVESTQYEHLDDVIFASELHAQLVKFKERNAKGRRGHTRRSARNQPTQDWS